VCATALKLPALLDSSAAFSVPCIMAFYALDLSKVSRQIFRGYCECGADFRAYSKQRAYLVQHSLQRRLAESRSRHGRSVDVCRQWSDRKQLEAQYGSCSAGAGGHYCHAAYAARGNPGGCTPAAAAAAAAAAVAAAAVVWCRAALLQLQVHAGVRRLRPGAGQQCVRRRSTWRRVTAPNSIAAAPGTSKECGACGLVLGSNVSPQRLAERFGKYRKDKCGSVRPQLPTNAPAAGPVLLVR
jgi:hypothetical protein